MSPGGIVPCSGRPRPRRGSSRSDPRSRGDSPAGTSPSLRSGRRPGGSAPRPRRMSRPAPLQLDPWRWTKAPRVRFPNSSLKSVVCVWWCTCSPAVCRPPLRAAGTSGRHTPSPSLRCGKPPVCPPRDCLRPPDARPRLQPGGPPSNQASPRQTVSASLCTCVGAAGHPGVLHVVAVVLLPVAMGTFIQEELVSCAPDGVQQDRAGTLPEVSPGPGPGHTATARTHTHAHTHHQVLYIHVNMQTSAK